MALTDDIIFILSNYPGGYKLMRARLHGYTGPIYFGHPQRKTEVSDETFYVTMSRLKKNGVVRNDKRIWSVTKKGLDYLKSLRSKECKTRKRSETNNVIISFDIPEKIKSRRNWLRRELVAHGFSMIQKSVWFGRAPLPKEFIEKLNTFKLLGYLKFFRAREWEIV
jgi:DNA-binding transcriptional regulator PaaX